MSTEARQYLDSAPLGELRSGEREEASRWYSQLQLCYELPLGAYFSLEKTHDAPAEKWQVLLYYREDVESINFLRFLSRSAPTSWGDFTPRRMGISFGGERAEPDDLASDTQWGDAAL